MKSLLRGANERWHGLAGEPSHPLRSQVRPLRKVYFKRFLGLEHGLIPHRSRTGFRYQSIQPVLCPLKCIGKQVLIPARDKKATVNVPEVASNFRRQRTGLRHQ